MSQDMAGIQARNPARKMHQTTVRFGEDLWEALEVEAERLGVSVAQYVRDAALRRLSYDAGRRDEFDAFGEHQSSTPPVPDIETSSSAALWAQGRQARRRAAELRSQTVKTRANREHLKT
jgi:hypothetical protein